MRGRPGRVNDVAMSRGIRGLSARILALVVLLAVAGAIVAGAAAARHQHDGPGLYDTRCPLEALGAFARTGGLVLVASVVPVEVAGALAAMLLVVRPTPTPAADTRLRAPPAR